LPVGDGQKRTRISEEGTRGAYREDSSARTA
jgi:hypothetical protein